MNIELTLPELMAALLLCGYEDIAKRTGKEYELPIYNIQSIIYEPEAILKETPYFDPTSRTYVTDEIECLVSDYVKAQRKYILTNNRTEQLLTLHDVDDKRILVQLIKDEKALFTIHEKSQSYFPLLETFYEMKDAATHPGYTLMMDETRYHQIHHMEELEAKQSNEQTEFITFAADMKQHGETLNFVIVLAEKGEAVQEPQFFVLNKDYIWLADMKAEEDEYRFDTVSGSDFFTKVASDMKRFFDTPYERLPEPKAKDPDKILKRFSWKRGWHCFLMCNAFIVVTALILWVDASNMVGEGGEYIIMYAVLLEAFTIILSLLSCLRPRVHNELSVLERGMQFYKKSFERKGM
ncbi:hypothetical protein FZC66_17930 [Priestia megaterium]|nr:hypothetical protein FZC66_17930 [Priestia megaterium]